MEFPVFIMVLMLSCSIGSVHPSGEFALQKAASLVDFVNGPGDDLDPYDDSSYLGLFDSFYETNNPNNPTCQSSIPPFVLPIYKIDILLLQFAQNLEYLEADYFLWGAFGYGLDVVAPELTQGGPPPIGARKANLDNLTESIIREFGLEEVGHLRALKTTVGGIPRPLMDLSPGNFANVVNEAFGYPLEPPFDPYRDSLSYMLASYIIPYVGLAGYVGANPNIRGYISKREGRKRGIEMEVSVSGNALKTFARSINCLSKLGNELAIQASTSQLALCTLNSSRSAYQSISFKPGYFDVYNISGTQVQFSILLKAVCAVLRTPLSSIDHLRMHLLDADATKVKWTLDCMNGLKKTYWINCNVEPDIQHLSLEKERFKSSLVIKPRDLNRLLSNFQSSLHEITIIATEPSSVPSEAENEIGGKAVELRSYIDPTNDNGASLHTQLWIDPVEEFLQYVHAGNPVDVTFGVRELKEVLPKLVVGVIVS